MTQENYIKLKLCVCVHACSVVPNSFATPWTVARQAPLSMEFSRQEYWSELPFPPPGDLPDLEIKPMFPALTGSFFNTELSGKPSSLITHAYIII